MKYPMKLLKHDPWKKTSLVCHWEQKVEGTNQAKHNTADWMDLW